MNAAQNAAFLEGTGGNFSASQLLFSIQAIGATVVLLYAVWIFYMAYNNWGEGIIKPKDMLTIWARCVFVMMVLLYLIIR